ncbi:hypothetical protein NE850_11595 [Paraburkholderia sp. USG1]|uniref:hypothetical protein n=1 Tax=Paraburkholderia sp. USG1 TaxID=2952268 RepID=UPI00285B8C53|nr:hypothetical protein [Paraburkholderia sp. USG1]MDR8396983.1 hypothetical protein [Paraburkholderia sp. USG1]
MAIYRSVKCRLCPAVFLAVSWIPCRIAGYCSPLCQIESGKPPISYVRELKGGGNYQDRHGRKIGQKLFDGEND